MFGRMHAASGICPDGAHVARAAFARFAVWAIATACALALVFFAAPYDAWAKTGSPSSSGAAAQSDAPSSVDAGKSADSPLINDRSSLTKRAVEGKNVTGKANVVQLFGHEIGHLGFSAENAITTETISGYDVTGDGMADRVRATITPQNPNDDAIETITDLSIYVNGILALDIDSAFEGDKQPFSSQFTVDLITLKNGQPYLLIDRADASQSNFISELYRYEDGSFVKVLSADEFAEGSHIDQHSMVVKPYGNNMDVTYVGVGPFLKRTRITMMYAYDRSTGGLKLRSNNAKTVLYECYTGSGSIADPRNYKYGAATLTTVKPFKAYAGMRQYQTAFTVKKGARVKIVGATVDGDDLFFRLRIADGKIGFTSADKGYLSYARYNTTRWFEEIGI